MARAATTADAFNAIAEPRRRQILDVLAEGERPVNDLVRRLGLGQPQVSKHLRVLREVGAVDVRSQGRERLYRLNGRALKPIHDWVKDYERSWSQRFDRLDVVLDELKQTKEEGVSLLDRTTLFFGSNLGNASYHSTTNLPVFLAGGGFKHGQHLAFDPKNHPPLCNLYVSMLQRLGIEVDKFGSSTGTLSGLEAVS